ncbi:GDSL-type esterase/lipase family protein [Lascolabacillus massiliensis]|uniref:GDSL-type esterase/lipase family protein n=1 Tax=Lascolabacillus massiliensis TaxID=1627894 RepID=UPI0006B39D13|nr:GDSL-type esterase/lipase family protein [Lascolabacillus massiliensis]
MRYLTRQSVILLFLFAFVASIQAQNGNHSTFYYQRVSLFEKLPVSNEDIIFLGNSITNGGEWAELLNDIRIKNRGISGDVCQGVLDRLNSIIDGEPSKIFLLIGINDLARGISSDSIVSGTEKIIDRIKSDSPNSLIYIQSILPVNDSFGMFSRHTKHKEIIKSLNNKLESLANSKKVKFIDLYSHFVTPGTNNLNPEYTNDGLHLMGEGYIKWIEIIKPYIYE